MDVESLDLSGEELAILTELLTSEHSKLLVEIRHTAHRTYREELRRRLGLVEGLLERTHHAPAVAPHEPAFPG